MKQFSAEEKVKLAESWGMRFGVMKESGKEEYLMIDIRPDSILGKMAEAQDREIMRDIDESLEQKQKEQNADLSHGNGPALT